MVDQATDGRAQAGERLRTSQITWLCTVREDGQPHAIPVWFWWDGEAVLIFSKPGDQKIKNLRANPRATLGLADSRDGSQVAILQGEAELLDAPTADIAPPAYYDKYAEGIRGLDLTAEQLAATYPQAIRFRPDKILAW